MNRKQRRDLARKINRMDYATQKARIFSILLTLTDVQRFSSISEINPLIDNYLDSFLIPSSLREMSVITQSINEQMSMEESFSLALLLCKKYESILCKFVKYKKEYESYLFSYKYEDAKVILGKIKSECGCSLWICGQKLIIEESLNGLEGNKKLLGSFFAETHRNTLISTLLDFMSSRAELTTSLNNYNEKVEKFLRLFDENTIPYFYFAYKLRIQDVSIGDFGKYILQIDSQLSIVDLYTSMVDIAQRSLVGTFAINEKQIGTLIHINSNIDDYLVRNIALFSSKEDSFFLDETVLEII